MKLLRVKDVAEILACSASEIYALTSLGMIPHLKIRGMLRFREQDIEEFINSRVVVRLDREQCPLPRPPQLKHLHL